MKFRSLIFTTCVFSCGHVFAQDTLASDSLARDTDFVIEYPWYSDSVIFSFNDSVPQQATYTVTVAEPNTCSDTTRNSTSYESPPLLVVIDESEGSRTYPWYTSWYPTSVSACMGPVYWPYKSWYTIDLFDTLQVHTARNGLAATQAKELSTFPQADKPEPAKPAQVPTQVWYGAVLPSELRIRKG